MKDTNKKTTELNYEGLADFLCGGTAPESKKAYTEYCEAYDEAHKNDEQMA